MQSQRCLKFKNHQEEIKESYIYQHILSHSNYDQDMRWMLFLLFIEVFKSSCQEHIY